MMSLKNRKVSMETLNKTMMELLLYRSEKNQENLKLKKVANWSAKNHNKMVKTQDKATKLQEVGRIKGSNLKMEKIKKEIRIISKKHSNKKVKRVLSIKSGKRITQKSRILELLQEESIKRSRR